MEEAAEADYIVIIDGGKISAEGTPHELKTKYVLNKVGIIPALMKELGKASKEDRPRLGQIINALKDWATEVFAEKEKAIKTADLIAQLEQSLAALQKL